ncbi:hypothetical protein BJ138DRAFT_1149498 [Hygrophoropsis aurantiaca]|uniref:Uncharacterized protein n=1 Tax=Hygrophoropsis aurantiaca TaxID=72124 RepID=A0ACB8AHD8_9AGAM|nr:hypothetical protein BJ138DRAFT_1149498 [Hygrophoropsis aurantiaca]
MSTPQLHLQYFAVRGRCEPVLILLADSGVPFTYEEISISTWIGWKTDGKITPDQLPYAGLPVLRVKASNESDKDFVLGETSAILTFLEEYLAPRTILPLDLPPETRARLRMIIEASLFFLNRVFQMSKDKDWLAPPTRHVIWNGIVTPYLRSTEKALSNLQSAAVIPSGADNLTALNAVVSAAICFITDLFPSSRLSLGVGGKYELCGRMWSAVEQRPRLQSYRETNQIQAKRWTISEYGTAKWIAEEAMKYDNSLDL